jgi:hypothetical protein
MASIGWKPIRIGLLLVAVRCLLSLGSLQIPFMFAAKASDFYNDLGILS